MEEGLIVSIWVYNSKASILRILASQRWDVIEWKEWSQESYYPYLVMLLIESISRSTANGVLI